MIEYISIRNIGDIWSAVWALSGQWAVQLSVERWSRAVFMTVCVCW